MNNNKKLELIKNERRYLLDNFDLNKSQALVFLEILTEEKEFTMKELIDKIKKDRTTIQRTLNKLLKKGLIQKKQVNLHKGYMYTYYVENKDDFKKTWLKEVDKRTTNVLNLINEL